MIKYLNCRDASIDDIYGAFMVGFSDYIIKIAMEKDMFLGRFFGPEGNSLEDSFVAMEGKRPVGLILGGIKEYEGIRTMRCGTLCIDPEYRGKGVSQRLFELHRDRALEMGCRQLFLEVIVGNDRAINFYRRLGYEKVYDLVYFTLKNTNQLRGRTRPDAEIREISMEELRRLYDSRVEAHINWQNDMEYIEKTRGYLNLGAFENGKILGAATFYNTSKLSFLWVDKHQRGKGTASALLAEGAERLNLPKISASTPNNAALEGFFKRMGFEKEKLAQYEMYMTL